MSRAREAANWIGTGVTSTELDKLDGFTGTVDDLNYAKDLRATGVTNTEFDYLDGVGSNLQTQLNAKQATITTGISNTNVLVANANVADDDFLRVDGTSIEGRTAAETLSDIGAAPLASPTFTGTTNVSSGVTLPASHIIQVVCGVERSTVHSTTQGWSDISSGLAVSITLSSSSNKVMILWNGGISGHGGWTPVTRVVRDQPSADTVVTAGTSSDGNAGEQGMHMAPGYGGNNETFGGQSACFIDTPNTTNAIEYQVQWYGRSDASGNNWLNQLGAGFQAYYGKGVSSLTLFEIKG